jgi:tetratricopeptide (TPR) repeat protein
LHDYRAALEMYKKLVADDPGNIDSRLSLAATYDKVGEALIKKRDAERAAEAFEAAMKLTVSATKDRSNAQLLYVIADSNTGLGDTMMIRALTAPASSDLGLQHFHDAETFYEESLRTWREVPEPGLVSFNGFRSTPPSIVTQKLEACRRAAGPVRQL